MYGAQSIVLNVHNLIYLSDSVKTFEALCNFDAFLNSKASEQSKIMLDSKQTCNRLSEIYNHFYDAYTEYMLNES